MAENENKSWADMSPEELRAAIAQLSAEKLAAQAETEKLRKAKSGASTSTRLSLRVSEKGALSVYGLGRFPVTLYAAQWERLLDTAPEVRAYLSEHASELVRKA